MTSNQLYSNWIPGNRLLTDNFSDLYQLLRRTLSIIANHPNPSPLPQETTASTHLSAPATKDNPPNSSVLAGSSDGGAGHGS